MTQNSMKNKLLEKGFDEEVTAILVDNLTNIASELSPMLEKWLDTGVEQDFESHGISLSELVSNYDMQYQAALLTMDWILKEPSVALEALTNGIR